MFYLSVFRESTLFVFIYETTIVFFVPKMERTASFTNIKLVTNIADKLVDDKFVQTVKTFGKKFANMTIFVLQISSFVGIQNLI